MIPSPAEAPAEGGPRRVVLLSLCALCLLLPPDVYGASAAAVGALAAVACALGAPGTGRWSGGFLALAPWLVLAARAGIAPGEAVEPAATLALVAAVGLAARASSVPAAGLAAALAWLGGRAIWEVAFGLEALAERARAADALPDAAAVVQRLEQGRPYGGLVTPAALGCVLAMLLPPVVVWAWRSRGASRVLGICAAGSGAVGLLLTRSVTAFGALAGAVALAALARRVRWGLLAPILAALAIAAGAAAFLRPDAVLSVGAEDSPLRLRAGNVRIALEATRDHPWLGVGPGGYAEVFPEYRREGDNEARHAHDLPAELLAEYGVPVGLALTVLFFAAFVGPVLRGRESTGLAVGLAAFALHNVVDFTAFVPSVMLVAVILRGAMAPAGPPAGRLRAASFALVSAAAAFLFATSGLARDALYEARAAVAARDRDAAVAFADRAALLAPWDADPPLLAAGTAEDGAGLEEATRAVRLAPSRAAAHAVRGNLLARAGDAPGAWAEYVEAARLYPMRREYADARDAIARALAGGAP